VPRPAAENVGLLHGAARQRTLRSRSRENPQLQKDGKANYHEQKDRDDEYSGHARPNRAEAVNEPRMNLPDEINDEDSRRQQLDVPPTFHTSASSFGKQHLT
jgi:hypothetical protein